MADRYWVGGNANWDATAGTKWALTSNGAGGQAVPTAADDVYFDGGSGAVTCTISGSRVAKSITCTGFTGTLAGTLSPALAISGSLTLVSGMTLTYAGVTTFNATGTITSAGKTLGGVTVNGAGITITLGDALTSSGNFILTQGALDLNDKTLSCLTFNSTNSNTRSIAFNTLGQINITGSAASIWSCNTLTNFSFTGTSKVNLTANATTGTRLAQHGNTAGGSESLAFNFNVTAGSDTATLYSYIRNLDFTGFSGTMSNNNVANYAIFGNLTLSPTMTAGAGSFILPFSSTTQTQIITTNGVTLDFPITLNGTKTYQLGSALTMGSTRGLTLTSGTLDVGIYNVTTGLFSSSNSNTRTLTMGSVTWTLTGTGVVWNTGTTTNLTLNANTSQINTTSTSTKTFSGGGRTYYNLSNTGSGTLTITGNNTYNNLSALGGCPLTISSGSTQSANTFTFQGASSITIAPSSTTNYTFTKLGGGIVDMQNVSISRCTATPNTLTWYATNSTDGGNNTGIIFQFTASLSESSNAQDTISETMSANASVSENANAQDSQYENAYDAVTILESGNAIDTQSQLIQFNSNVIEVGNAQDTQNANITSYLILTESVNAQDTQSALLSALLAIAESGNASDLVIAQLIAQLNQHESANLLDNTNAGMSAPVSIVESSNALDIESVLVSVSKTITEQAQALDLSSEQTYVILTIIENGNAIDVYYCEPIFNSSEKVWHVLPRSNKWNVDKRNDYWDVSPRLDYWNVNE